MKSKLQLHPSSVGLTLELIDARREIVRLKEELAKAQAQARSDTAGPSDHAGLVAVAELIRTCPDCHGTGLVDEVQSSLFAGQPPPNKIPCACCEAIAVLSRAPEAVADGNYCSFCDVKFSGTTCPSCKGHISLPKAVVAPPVPQPALALIEELEGVLRRVVDYVEPTCPLGRSIDAALASAKRFKEGA